MTSLQEKYMHDRPLKPSLSFVENLSERELQVFHMLGEGKMTRHIASELGLRISTVNTFRYRMMKKLDLKHSFELVLFANQWTRESMLRTLKPPGLVVAELSRPYK